MLTLFAATNTCSGGAFLGFKSWWAYLPQNDFDGAGSCSITTLNVLGGKSDFLLIGLAVVDDLLRIAALVAVAMVLYGGFQFITSQGSPDGTAKAQKTIIGSLAGLVIAVVATALVTFLGNKLGAV